MGVTLGGDCRVRPRVAFLKGGQHRAGAQRRNEEMSKNYRTEIIADDSTLIGERWAKTPAHITCECAAIQYAKELAQHELDTTSPAFMDRIVWLYEFEGDSLVRTVGRVDVFCTDRNLSLFKPYPRSNFGPGLLREAV